MRGGEESAQAESPALVIKRCSSVFLASTALAAVAAFSLPTRGTAVDLDLNGIDVTLPVAGSFGGAAFINGTDNATNSGAVNATLTEGGGPAGTTYSGSIADGATNTTALVHTGGTVTILSTNTFSGGTTISGGTVIIGSGATLGTGTLSNSGTLTMAAGGALTNSSLTNSGAVNAQGVINGPITNQNAGTFTVTGNLVGSVSTFTNESGGTLAVRGNSLTGIATLNNNSGGTISLAGGTIGAGTTNNSGLVRATGVSTFTGAFNNQAGGVINLSGGATPTSNRLTAGSFNGSPGSAINLAFNLSNTVGQAGQLISNTGNSGSTTVNFTNVGGPVVLGGLTPTPVIVNNGPAGSGTLSATAGTGVGSFGLVNVSLQPVGNGNFDLFRTANTGALAAPGASIMAALSAVDTSFHQSTSPFVVSPQSQDPDKWSGGIWTRVGGGQVTTKSTAFDGITGSAVPLRVKTNYDAFEVGIDSGLLNFGGSGWNGHFGVLGGTVTATSNETLVAPGTQLKFDVPFAGVYGVMTRGPLFMDLSVRHDWADVKVTNFPANLNNTDLKGHSTSVASAVGYHFDLVDHWFVEPAAGFGLTQTQFNTLQTNLNQTAQGIAPGTISFDSMLSMLVHAGARVGTTTIVADKLALQPFGTLSVWRELGGELSSTFAQAGGVADAIALDRVGTFYQAGIGVTAQLLDTGFVGFARGDVRWGDRLDGMSIIGGVRYTFAP